MGWRRRVGPAVAALALGAAAACADRLPDQDRRILAAPPQAKLSTDILWSDYQADRGAADRRYRGKVVEVSGKVSSVSQDPARIVFLQQEQPPAGVEARLLDDRAAATLAAASVGQRLTLRCFCEGVATNVVLKSCIKP